MKFEQAKMNEMFLKSRIRCMDHDLIHKRTEDNAYILSILRSSDKFQDIRTTFQEPDRHV
jgi:hypothetical protein